MIKRTDEISPEEIVKLARDYIQKNLSGDLRTASIAKAIGIGIQDLRGSYRCTTTTSTRREVKKTRLQALYDEVKDNPYEHEEKQIRKFGLRPGAKLMMEFEQEFWISLKEHREHSRQNRGNSPASTRGN